MGTAAITNETRSEAAAARAERRGLGVLQRIWPRLSILAAAVLLAVSNLFAWWNLTLNAPQYPGGLHVTLYTHKLTGDVREIDGLNHYIGMMPLGDAAGFERSVAMVAMTGFVIMGILAAVMVARRYAWLALPIALFPVAFFLDLAFWLYRAGHNLDPTAALSSSIKPFTPSILGRGEVGQFSTDAMFATGYWIAIVAAILAIAGIVGRLRSSGDRT